MESFESVCDYLKTSTPIYPVLCHRPHAAERSASWFLQNFPGDVLYAVKANASPLILKTLYDTGVRHFDIASLSELLLVRKFCDARFYCMNTVKHPAHIKKMYWDYGVRDFALDCLDELTKILNATENANDLRLHVRISVDNSASEMPLDKKFGAIEDEAVPLLIRARTVAEELGICFHVGSQAMDPNAYRDAIREADRLISSAGVILDSLDVGGGFPAAYPGLEPPPLIHYVEAIESAFSDSLTNQTCRLLCEPGRALVAEAASQLVNVTLRKGNWLHLDDGAYGSLYDAAHVDFPFPVRVLRNGRLLNGSREAEFRFYGPTCDSLDAITRPYKLPADVQAGDLLEFGQLGAYSDTLRTQFNGFGERMEIIVRDEPMLSLFDQQSYPIAAGQFRPLLREH